jgi:hypothetical protein
MCVCRAAILGACSVCTGPRRKEQTHDQLLQRVHDVHLLLGVEGAVLQRLHRVAALLLLPRRHRLPHRLQGARGMAQVQGLGLMSSSYSTVVTSSLSRVMAHRRLLLPSGAPQLWQFGTNGLVCCCRCFDVRNCGLSKLAGLRVRAAAQMASPAATTASLSHGDSQIWRRRTFSFSRHGS